MPVKQQIIYDEKTRKEKRPRGPRVVKLPETPLDNHPEAPPKEVINEVKKAEVKQEVMQTQKLNELADQSKRILFKCSAVFPFDFFPDELSVESSSVNLKRHMFFWTSQMVSIPIKNISDVILNTIPFFATLTFVDQFFTQNTIKIGFLKRSDAQRAHKIIQGLVIATREGVDVSCINPDELIKKAEEIGSLKAIKED